MRYAHNSWRREIIQIDTSNFMVASLNTWLIKNPHLHRVEGNLQLGNISQYQCKPVARRLPRESRNLLLFLHSLNRNERFPHTEDLEVVVLHGSHVKTFETEDGRRETVVSSGHRTCGALNYWQASTLNKANRRVFKENPERLQFRAHEDEGADCMFLMEVAAVETATHHCNAIAEHYNAVDTVPCARAKLGDMKKHVRSPTPLTPVYVPSSSSTSSGAAL